MCFNEPSLTKQNDGDRRRRFRHSCARFACSCTVKPQKSEQAPERKGALLLNICPDGVCFESNFEPSVGERLHIGIRPIIGPEVTARIRVLHARPSMTNGFYIVGSEFDDLEECEKQNLVTLIHTIDRFEEDLAEE